MSPAEDSQLNKSSSGQSAPSLRSRILGSLLAHHSGDSLGATLEFKTAKSIRRLYPQGLRDIIGGGALAWKAGHATDDSDMTRAVLLAYHHALTDNKESEVNPRNRCPGFDGQTDIATVAGCFFLDWFQGDNWPGRKPGSRPRDIGNATLVGLLKFRDGGYDVDKAGAGQDAAGNGSLMRCLPTGLLRWGSPPAAHGDDAQQRQKQEEDEKETAAQRERESIRISRITHDDDRCVASCAVYNTIVARLVQGLEPLQAVKAGLALAKEMETTYPNLNGAVVEALQTGIKLSSVAGVAENGASPEDFTDSCRGYVMDSLILAVAAVLDERSLEDILVDVVRVGNDTDTNAAIAGGLLGARDGESAIPERWKSTLQFREEYTRLVDDIVLAMNWVQISEQNTK